MPPFVPVVARAGHPAAAQRRAAEIITRIEEVAWVVVKVFQRVAKTAAAQPGQGFVLLGDLQPQLVQPGLPPQRGQIVTFVGSIGGCAHAGRVTGKLGYTSKAKLSHAAKNRGNLR